LDINFPLHKRMINVLLPTAASPQKTTLYIRLKKNPDYLKYKKVFHRFTRMED
jgi:hypothetical protein